MKRDMAQFTSNGSKWSVTDPPALLLARAVTINKKSDDAKLALTHRLRGATFSLDHFKILCTFAWLVSVFTKLMDLLSGFEPRVVF